MLKQKYAKFVEIYSMCPVIITVTYVGSIGYENRSILLKVCPIQHAMKDVFLD